MQKFRSIMEKGTCVCDDALDDNEWASELTIFDRNKSFGGSKF